MATSRQKVPDVVERLMNWKDEYEVRTRWLHYQKNKAKARIFTGKPRLCSNSERIAHEVNQGELSDFLRRQEILHEKKTERLQYIRETRDLIAHRMSICHHQRSDGTEEARMLEKRNGNAIKPVNPKQTIDRLMEFENHKTRKMQLIQELYEEHAYNQARLLENVSDEQKDAIIRDVVDRLAAQDERVRDDDVDVSDVQEARRAAMMQARDDAEAMMNPHHPDRAAIHGKDPDLYLDEELYVASPDALAVRVKKILDEKMARIERIKQEQAERVEAECRMQPKSTPMPAFEQPVVVHGLTGHLGRMEQARFQEWERREREKKLFHQHDDDEHLEVKTKTKTAAPRPKTAPVQPARTSPPAVNRLQKKNMFPDPPPPSRAPVRPRASVLDSYKSTADARKKEAEIESLTDEIGRAKLAGKHSRARSLEMRLNDLTGGGLSASAPPALRAAPTRTAPHVPSYEFEYGNRKYMPMTNTFAHNEAVRRILESKDLEQSMSISEGADTDETSIENMDAMVHDLIAEMRGKLAKEYGE